MHRPNVNSYGLEVVLIGGPIGIYKPSSRPINRRPSDQIKIQTQKSIESERSVNDSYKRYVDKSEITKLQTKKINERRETIVNILKKDHVIKESHLIGSFTRGTMVGPLKRESDTDVMIVLDANEHRNWADQENGSKNCLQSIKRTIENDPQFANTEVRIDRNAVTVKYRDSTIEIVPAFYYNEVKGAGKPTGVPHSKELSDGYAIPDTHSNSWVGTNPRRYKSMLKARDNANDGKVVRLTKIMKKCRDENNMPVNSYHMEIMVYNYFEEKSRSGKKVPKSDSEMVNDFASSLPQRLKVKTREPVYNESVDNYLTPNQRSEAVRKAVIIKKQIKDSKHLEDEGDTESAKMKLRKTFGNNFN